MHLKDNMIETKRRNRKFVFGASIVGDGDFAPWLVGFFLLPTRRASEGWGKEKQTEEVVSEFCYSYGFCSCVRIS